MLLIMSVGFSEIFIKFIKQSLSNLQIVLKFIYTVNHLNYIHKLLNLLFPVTVLMTDQQMEVKGHDQSPIDEFTLLRMGFELATF